MFPAQTTPPVAAPSVDVLALKDAIGRLEARLNADTGNTELLSRLNHVERDIKTLLESETDQRNARIIKSLQDSVTAISKTVARLSPDKTGIPALISPYIEAMAEAVAGIEKDVNRRIDSGLADVRADFRSLAVNIKSSVDQLSAIANVQTTQASEKLISAARFFAYSPVGKSSGAKGHGIVEQSILRGVSQ